MTDTTTPAPVSGAQRARRRGVVLTAVALAAVVAVAAILFERNRSMSDVVVPSSGAAAPTASELAVAAQARVLFGHQSVGDNILGGVEPVYAAADVSPPLIVDTREPVDDADAYIAHTHIGANGDPVGKAAEFVSVAAGPLGDAVDVFILKFCYVDITAASDVQAVFDAYVAAMDAVQEAHPDAVVLYTTVPLTVERGGGVGAAIRTLLGRGATDSDDNAARARYNELIREAFGATGRLFDIAAVEAVPGSDPESLRPELTGDGGHLNEAGAQAAAAELLRVVASTVTAG